MFAISTSDYAIARGDRTSSPIATDEERAIFRINQQNKRDKIESELHKIPFLAQKNLMIFMKCLYSDYVE